MVIDDPLSDARLAALTEAISSRRAEAPGPVDLRLVPGRLPPRRRWAQQLPAALEWLLTQP